MYNPQDEVKKRLQQQQQLQQYRNNQKKYGIGDYTKLGYGATKAAGQIGKSLSNSTNSNLANLGNNLYKYTGQQAIDGFKTKGIDSVVNGIKGIGDKINTLQNPNLGSVLGNLGTSAGNTQGLSAIGDAAGKVINGASGATSALGPALGVLNTGASIAEGDLKDSLVHGTATAASAFGGPIGMAIGGAIELGNSIYDMFAGGKQQEAQDAMQGAMQQNAQSFENKKQDAMNGLVNNPIKQDIYNQVNSDMPSSSQNMSFDNLGTNTSNTQEKPLDLSSITEDNVGSFSTQDLQNALLELEKNKWA